jgi:hypothetical protein
MAARARWQDGEVRALFGKRVQTAHSSEKEMLFTLRAAIFRGTFMFLMHHPGRAQDDRDKRRIAKLLADIQRVDGSQSISSHNSQVVIVTPAIEKIVSSGPAALNDLVLAMRHETISFDAFTRCYSASDQIIRAADPKLSVFWYGGSHTKEIDNVTRVISNGAIDKAKFRKEVVADIEAKSVLVLKKKRN